MTMAPSSPAVIKQSPWHTPVPYFFGGLAAVLGLIAFALLILACTYLNPTDDDQNNGDEETDLEAGDAKSDSHKKELTVFEDKYLVIMAGDAKPTFLATPVTSKTLSFGSCGCRSNPSEKSSTSEKVKEGSNDQLQVRNTENQ
ncbi:unnamed protein product [Lactuca saligna]|uniref:Uncharacterized protein n=1 Tax=Lactuca saligna TaxID=75948 RepID=A0AA35ZSQ3_LACSI|nr:unnamed protein product [Lactuca saligna]